VLKFTLPSSSSTGKLLSVLFVLTTFATAVSQTAFNREWETVFGSPESDQWATTVMDGNGDIYTTGNTKVSDAETAILTIRQDCDGNTLWEKEFTHPGGTAKSYGIALTADGSGNIYVAGTGNLASSGNYDLLVIKYDSQGDQTWQYTFDGGSDDIGTGLVVDAGGNVYVSAASKGASTGFDYLLIRLNSSGSPVWNKVQDFSQLDDFPTGLELTASESELVVSGVSASTAIVWNFATVKRNTSNGNITGSNITDAQGAVLDEPAGFAKDSSGNYYLSGTVTVAPGKTIIKTIKFDNSLNLVWEKEFSGSGKTNKARTISVDNDGNAYIGGHTTNQSGDVHFILIKYSPAGNELWTRVRQPRNGEHSEILCSAIDGGGNVAAVAEVQRSGSSFSLTMKFAPDGKKVWEHLGNGGGNRRETPKAIFPKDDCVTVTEVVTETFGTEESRRYRNVKFCESACDFGSPGVVTGESGDSLYVANQVIVKFNRTVVNTVFVDDTDKQFGTVEEIIADSLLIAQMDSILGASGSLRSGWEMKKIFKKLTSQVTATTTRRGRTIPVPDFWTTFLLCLPEGTHAAADIPGTAQQLEGLERIIYAEPNHVYTLDIGCPATDERYADWQANLHPTTAPNNTWLNGHINMEDAWCIEQGKGFVRVGVFDDGIDWEQEDFGDGTQGGSKIKGGYDYANGESFPNMVPNGAVSHHGTPVAGIIGALRNNAATPSGKSIAGIAGGDVDGVGNSGVSLFSMRIFDSNSTGNIANAFFEGTFGNTDPDNGFTEGLDVFSNSWGSPSIDATLERQVYFAYRNEVILGASRGNNGTEVPRFPCTFEDEWIMCIGASDTEGHWKMENRNYNPDDVTGNDNGRCCIKP
jgi:Subtilase family/Beta-propeller repeat